MNALQEINEFKDLHHRNLLPPLDGRRLDAIEYALHSPNPRYYRLAHLMVPGYLEESQYPLVNFVMSMISNQYPLGLDFTSEHLTPENRRKNYFKNFPHLVKYITTRAAVDLHYTRTYERYNTIKDMFRAMTEPFKECEQHCYHVSYSTFSPDSYYQSERLNAASELRRRSFLPTCDENHLSQHDLSLAKKEFKQEFNFLEMIVDMRCKTRFLKYPRPSVIKSKNQPPSTLTYKVSSLIHKFLRLYANMRSFCCSIIPSPPPIATRSFKCIRRVAKKIFEKI